jgi:hypothetical protein
MLLYLIPIKRFFIKKELPCDRNLPFSNSLLSDRRVAAFYDCDTTISTQ